jgi:endonuclease-3
MPGKVAFVERPATSLPRVIARLSALYDPEAPRSDPLQQILWENIGYLIDDDRRHALFRELRSQVGLDSAAILRAPEARLLEIARRGGMQPEKRVARWREIADIVERECAGNLAERLKALPIAKARVLLKRFPGIGDPGADKILLFGGLDVRPSVDSNGLRVLVRLGCIPPGSSYAETYKVAVGFLSQFCKEGRTWLVSCHLLLREHGRVLCKRTMPRCIACPLDSVCAHASAKGL